MKRSRSSSNVVCAEGPTVKKKPCLRCELAAQRSCFLERENKLLQQALNTQRLLLASEQRASQLINAAKKRFHAEPRRGRRARKEHKFHWLCSKPVTLPGEIVKYITTYLTDDVRFKLRGTCLLLYGCYFNQKIEEHDPKFNFLRAVNLARLGRRFPRVAYLHLPDNHKLSKAEFEAINPFHFPALTGLHLCDACPHLRHLPRNPRLDFLSFKARKDEWMSDLTESKFPALDELQVLVSNGRIAMAPHSSLRTLKFYTSERETPTMDWRQINLNFYPNLKEVFCFDNMRLDQSEVRRLEGLGLEVTLPDDEEYSSDSSESE